MTHLIRHTHRLPAVCLAAGMLVTAASSIASAPQPIDNEQVRVLKFTLQPHVRTTPHRHRLNRVLVYLRAGRQEIVSAGGNKTVLHWKAGDVKWRPAGGRETAEIVSGAPVPVVEMEIKRPGKPGTTFTSALDPLTAAANQAKLEFENPQVRVFRVNVAPRQTLGMHLHVVNRVVVYLTDLNERVTTGNGKVALVRHHAAEPVWGGPIKHQEENLSDTPIRAVVVELKD